MRMVNVNLHLVQLYLLPNDITIIIIICYIINYVIACMQIISDLYTMMYISHRIFFFFLLRRLASI